MGKKVLIEETTLNDLSLKLQDKLGTDKKFVPSNFKDKIDDIEFFKIVNDYYGENLKLDFFPTTAIDLDFTNPADFTRANYIESRDGAFTDINFIRNGSTNISMEMEFEAISTNTGAEYGSFGINSSNAGGSCALTQYSGQWSLLEPGVSYHQFGSVALQNYNVTLSLSGNTATLSGDISSSVTSSNYSTSSTFNNTKTRIAWSAAAPLRVKKIKCYREGILECSVYACYHTATGIAGFFDEENNLFYMNMGSGSFTAG